MFVGLGCVGMDYYPGGMQMPGRKFTASSSSYRYGFNGQENSTEIAAGLTTAMYWEYDSRIGRRWNVDPVLKEWESPYLCFSGNPILLSDPDGDNPIIGLIIGAFTEYAGIIGSKMLTENMTFIEANKSLGWGDAWDIAVAWGFGAATGAIDGGIKHLVKWLKNPTNQKILTKLLEVGINALESGLKQLLKDEEFDLKSILYGALAEVGLGSLLKTDVYKKAADDANKSAVSATKRADDLVKRSQPNQRLINNAKKEATSQAKTSKAFKQLDNAGKTAKETVAKTGGNIVQNKTAPVPQKQKEKKTKEPAVHQTQIPLFY